MIHDTKRIRIRDSRYETNLLKSGFVIHDTVWIHGFAKRIHVFTNLLYESRILTRTPLFFPSRISLWTEKSSFYSSSRNSRRERELFQVPESMWRDYFETYFHEIFGNRRDTAEKLWCLILSCHIDTWTSPIQYIINIFSKTLWSFQNLSREIKPKSQTLLLCLFSTTRCGLVIVTSIRLI